MKTKEGPMSKLLLICAVVAALVTGCGTAEDADEGAAPLTLEPCAVKVVQANLCPDGRSAICIVSGPDGHGGPPIGVIGCLVAHTPAECVTAYAECVRECQ
jgi:hypothetical protein